MLKIFSIIATIFVLCTLAIADDKAKDLYAATTPPVTAIPPGVLPPFPPMPPPLPPNEGKPGPLISPEQSMKMSPEEAAKYSTVIPNPHPGPLKPAPTEIPPPQFEPVLAPPPPPPPSPGPQVGTAVAMAGSIPKGWTDCEKTHAAKQCKTLTLQGHKDGKFIIKLPENGSVDDLNKFLDAAAASKVETTPK